MGLMEILNGFIKKVVARSERKAFMGNRHTYRSYVCLCLIPLCCLSLVGCSLKPALITGAATTVAVGVTSVLAPRGGVLVLAVVGGTTVVIASALTAERSVNGEPISVTAETVVQAAPDNFWTLLGELVSLGGWALLLVVLVPMVFSWLMPGPVQFKHN